MQIFVHLMCLFLFMCSVYVPKGPEGVNPNSCEGGRGLGEKDAECSETLMYVYIHMYVFGRI